MSWADYSHVVPGVKICDTCAIKNLKWSLDWYGDTYDETDLLTLERAVALVDQLNANDPEASPEDDKFRPILFDPEPGQVCPDCKVVAA